MSASGYPGSGAPLNNPNSRTRPSRPTPATPTSGRPSTMTAVEGARAVRHDAPVAAANGGSGAGRQMIRGTESAVPTKMPKADNKLTSTDVSSSRPGVAFGAR